MSSKRVIITNEVVCTWPADDVTIIQTVNHPQYLEPIINRIGIGIDDVDQLILDLQRAKAEAVGWNESCDAYFKEQQEKHGDTPVADDAETLFD